MPPIVALLLCTIFVIYMLRLDKKQAPDVSGFLWIPTIWILIIASKPLGVWFGNEDAEGSPMDRNFLILLLLIDFFLLFKRRLNLSRAIRENIWLLLLLGFMLVSILWSDIPFVSFKRWSREVLAVVMAFLLLAERNPRKAVESILRRLIYITIPFSLLLIKYFPEYGVLYGSWDGAQMWVGVTLHKNSLGMLCITSAFFLIWSLVKRWQKHGIPVSKYHTLAEVLVLSIAIWLLIAGGEGKTSATANTAFAVALAAFAGLLLMKKYKLFVGAGVLMAIIAAGIIYGTVTFFGVLNFSGFSSSIGREGTLSDRTDTWAKLVPVVMRQPILGGGFGSFWTFDTREFYQMSNAHNGYLEIFLELGFVGWLLFLMLLLSCCRKAHRVLAYDYDWGVLLFCYMLILVLYNITESSINSLTSFLMVIVLLLSVTASTFTRCKP